MINLINIDNDKIFISMVTLTTTLIITTSYVLNTFCKIHNELFDIIDVLNSNCIKLTTYDLDLKFFSEKTSFIKLKNKTIRYTNNHYITNINWWIDCEKICIGICDSNFNCCCKQKVHSKMISDIQLRLWLNSAGYNINKISDVVRFNNNLEFYYKFNKQVNNLKVLNNRDVIWYYKNFTDFFNKYNNFSDEYLYNYYLDFKKN